MRIGALLLLPCLLVGCQTFDQCLECPHEELKQDPILAGLPEKPVQESPVKSPQQNVMVEAPPTHPVVRKTTQTITESPPRLAWGFEWFKIPIPCPRLYTVPGPKQVTTETKYVPAQLNVNPVMEKSCPPTGLAKLGHTTPPVERLPNPIEPSRTIATPETVISDPTTEITDVRGLPMSAAETKKEVQQIRKTLQEKITATEEAQETPVSEEEKQIREQLKKRMERLRRVLREQEKRLEEQSRLEEKQKRAKPPTGSKPLGVPRPEAFE